MVADFVFFWKLRWLFWRILSFFGNWGGYFGERRRSCQIFLHMSMSEAARLLSSASSWNRCDVFFNCIPLFAFARSRCVHALCESSLYCTLITGREPFLSVLRCVREQLTSWESACIQDTSQEWWHDVCSWKPLWFFFNCIPLLAFARSRCVHHLCESVLYWTHITGREPFLWFLKWVREQLASWESACIQDKSREWWHYVCS